MGESKIKKMRQVGMAQKMMTVGIVATQWDTYPKVPVATSIFSMPISDFKQLGATNVSRVELLGMIGNGFASGQNGTRKFCGTCAAYIAQTNAFAEALKSGRDGIWMKVLTRGGNFKARLYGIADASDIEDLMKAVRAETLSKTGLCELVYSTHPDDASFTGVKFE